MKKKGRSIKELQAYEGILIYLLNAILISYRLVYYFYFFLYY